MVNSNTDFFKVINNFARIGTVRSIPIKKVGITFKPQVTVVIPTHKRPALLKAAIESVLSQADYPEFELIVVDDDPTRDCPTEILLKTFTDERISYYKNAQNLGMINNWNRCFELANAEWVVMLHDDDLLLDFFLNECMEILKRQKHIGILKPKWYHWNDDGNELVLPPLEASGRLNRVYEISQIMADRIGAPTGIVINKEKFVLLGGFNPEYFPSSDKCLVTLFAHYFEVYQLDKVASVYRFLCNDSLKVEILAGFLTNDTYLFRYLCKYFKVPKILAENFIGYKFRNMVAYYTDVNPNFKFDKGAIGLIEPNAIAGRIGYKLTYRIAAVSIVFYKKFGDRIFKSRQRKLTKVTL